MTTKAEGGALGLKVLVCGGRDFADGLTLNDVLDSIHGSKRGPVRLLVHGNARGADALAKAWAESRGLLQRWWNADWQTQGRAAGPKRNQKMLEEARPDLVVAFPGGRGTADMVKRALDAGVEVIRVNYSEQPRAAPVESSAASLSRGEGDANEKG